MMSPARPALPRLPRLQAGQVVALRRLLEPSDPGAALRDPAIQDGKTLELLGPGFAMVEPYHAPGACPLVPRAEQGLQATAVLAPRSRPGRLTMTPAFGISCA